MRALGIAVGGQNREEFVKEMRRWEVCLQRHGHKVATCAVKKEDAQKPLFAAALMGAMRYDLVAIFCHGYPRRIQLNFDEDDWSLNCLCDDSPFADRVVLYCCSTARQPATPQRYDECLVTKGSFAAKLSEISTVFAHTTAGHTTKNPYVVRFGTDGSYQWMINPARKRNWKKWKKWLKGDGRFLFPIMDVAEVRETIRKLAGNRDD